MADLRATGGFLRRHAIAGIALALIAHARVRSAETIERARRESRSEEYVPPAPEAIALATRLFEGLFRAGEDAARLSPLAREAGLELVEAADRGEVFLVVREPAGARHGRGFFAFRRGAARPIVFQAPHSRDDLLTGPLATRLLRESGAAAAAWSTAPRTARTRDPAEPADLARLSESLLGSFTRAFAAVHPKGTVVQLHGFDGEARRSSASAGWRVVLSGGTRSPPEWLLASAPCLEAVLGERVAVFPRDTRELGGTTNAQGKLLRSLGHAGFLHVEMDLETRRRLHEAGALRSALVRCLPGAGP
jgi:hypothetical protein